MKSYLSLIPISAKIRKKQNRMTILCIIISVLLITTVFSIADMMIRTESSFMIEKHGNWHISLKHISNDTAQAIKNRSDVTAIGRSESFNVDFDLPYYIGEKRAALYGADETYITKIADGLLEGNFPQNNSEIMLTENAKDAIDAQIGSHFTLHTPAGDTDFTVSGFGSDDEEYYRGQFFGIGVTMTQETFADIMAQNKISEDLSICYIQFQDAAKAASAKLELKEQYQLLEDDISENTGVMGMAGKSDNKSMKNIYGAAAILFFLVLLAGILMISGSMNSSVSKRTQFFGMMRCIGASRRQIIKFVRLEALNWCKTAIPVGIIIGTVISWGICAFLHYGIGGEFITTPVFKISPIGIICGAVVGIATVLLAARSPAKHASKVSPIMAVSGNAQNTTYIHHAIKLSFGKIEKTLGIHHALVSKKNWILMTSSFALNIILFLCFSVGLDLFHALIPCLRSWQPDITLNGYANALILDKGFTDKISTISGVSHVFGCSYIDNISVSCSHPSVKHINLVSYDDYMMKCAKESVSKGDISEVTKDSNKVMTIYNKDNPLKVGDIIELAGQKIEITCALSDGLFASDLIVICPEETFSRLVGAQKYSLIGVQLDKNADNQTIKQISTFADKDVIFSNEQENNKENTATYYATQILVYGFLAIIGMITIFNIINSISMSVSARVKQYGAMRAVGMDDRQLIRMIFAETFTYAVSGLIVGLAIGLPLSKFLYIVLITNNFGLTWPIPVTSLIIITTFIFVSVIAAVYTPAKQIKNMEITEAINEL